MAQDYHSATYRVLAISELAAQIARECYYYKQDACYVATFASVCQIVREPATDALWEDIYSFAPLVYTLPRDAYEVDQEKSVVVRP